MTLTFSNSATAQTFQITFPDNGFSGLVLKPWGERKRTVFEIVPEVQDKVSRIPGIQTFAATPPALPGGGQFPVEFVIGATAEPGTILKYAQEIGWTFVPRAEAEARRGAGGRPATAARS